MPKTVEDSAKSIKKSIDSTVKTTEEVAGTVNKGVEKMTGHPSAILDNLGQASKSATVGTINKIVGVGVAGATTATAGNQLIGAIQSGNLRGITDAMAKGATSINDLLTQLNALVPGFPKAQIPTQITSAISRLKDGQAVYDAAGSMVTALVTDAAGGLSFSSVATLMSHFDKNWDTFSSKIDALFQVTPANGQQAVLETLAKNLFGERVYNAAGVIKRQIPGVMTGVLGVQDAIKQFGGSYRNPIEAATKIRNGVEKMVQSIEKISQSLNNIVKFYQGDGDISNGTGYPLLDTLGKLGDLKGIKALDTALRVGGGAAAVAGNAGALAQAIKNKDIKGAVTTVKKTIDDVKKLTKKGNYKTDGSQSAASSLSGNSTKASNSSDKDNQQSPKNNNNQSSASSDSYVCSGATMKCTMGTSQAKLTVLPTRTVFLTGQPMANISDHLSMVNLAPFGRCRSMGFPATASATAANHGTLTPMPCMHNTQFPWMGGKNDYIVKGDPALLKSSTCQCLWGGTISIVNDGQTGEGTHWVSKSQKEGFDANQSNTEGIDVNTVLDGIQLALDAAGFLPGVGAAPDLLNAAISALRGNWSEAGMSLFAAIPLIGDAAAAGKIAYKGVKIAKLSKGGQKLITKEAKKYISKSITKEELLAKGICKSENEVKAFERALKSERKKFAEQFYAKHRMDPKVIKSHVNGIDLSQPVKVKKMPPPEVIHRFEDPTEISKLKNDENKIGSYFFPPKQTGMPPTTPRKLGVQPVVIKDGKMIRKKKITMKIDKNASNIEYLESTASALPAPLNNDWGSSKQNIFNWKRTKGGAIQMYLPPEYKKYLNW